MKKFLLILGLSVFVVAMDSCKKPPLPIITDTDSTGGGSGSGGGSGGGNETSEYVGTWNYTNIDLKNGTLSFQGNDVGNFEGKGVNVSGTIVISDNPNTYSTSVSFTADVDATFFGQTQNQQIPVVPTTSTGTWTESDGEITLNDDSGKPISVISSSSSKIIFTGNFSEQLALGQGIGVDANSDVEFTVSK